jgi:hypothetical protein
MCCTYSSLYKPPRQKCAHAEAISDEISNRQSTKAVVQYCTILTAQSKRRHYSIKTAQQNTGAVNDER